MKRYPQFNVLIVLLVLILQSKVSIGQGLTDDSGNKISPYYIDLNSVQRSNVVEVRGDFLHVQYFDHYNKEKLLAMTIQDWKGVTLADLKLSKIFGLNNFDINFKDHNIPVAANQVYLCSVKDESGKIHAFYFRYLIPIKKEITASIFVKPQFVECNNAAGSNLIEYYGTISGGKAPYYVNWYVMNKARSEFLYHPDPSKVLQDGYTSSIQVDQSPEYYVLLYVKDACGNEQTSTIDMTCEENKRKINSVFFQSIDNALQKNLTSSH